MNLSIYILQIYKKSSIFSFLLLAILVLNIEVFSQITTNWSICYGGSSNDEAHNIIQTNDGGYILLGETQSGDQQVSGYHGYRDSWIVKINANGEIEWEKCFGGTEIDELSDAIQLSNGNYIFAGHTTSNDCDISGNHGSYDAWVVYTDSIGNILWQKCYGGSINDLASSIIQLDNGNYLVGGHTGSNDGDVSGNHSETHNDVWIFEIDSIGNLIWQKCYGGSNFDVLYTFQKDNENNIIFSGATRSTDGDITGHHGGEDILIIKINQSGDIIWQKSLGGYEDEYGGYVNCTSDGGYIMTCSTASSNGDVSINFGGLDIWVVKLSSVGDIEWETSLGGSLGEMGYTVIETDSGEFIVGGDVVSNDGMVLGRYCDNHYYCNGGDAWLIKLDSNGHLIWQKCMGGFDHEVIFEILNTSNGDFTFIARTTSVDNDISNNHGSHDYWAVNFSEEKITGKVFYDYNENCIQDSAETNLQYQTLIIEPGSHIVQTNQSGIYSLDNLGLEPDNYSVFIDTTNSIWQPTCQTSQTFEIIDPDIFTSAPNFGVNSNVNCSEPRIEIYMPSMRPGFSNQNIYVKVLNNNTATTVIDSAYVLINLPDLITINDANIPYSVDENIYCFELGNIFPGQIIEFTANAQVNSNAIIGQTLCLEANLYPVDSCVFVNTTNSYNTNGGVSTCNEPWGKSSLSVDGICSNDSIIFTVLNAGSGDMVCYSPVRIYIDSELFILDSIKLNSGQARIFSFEGTGQTWRLEADQHPMHPGNSHPNAVIELCGDLANWTPNLVTIQYLDNADPVTDIYCGTVTGSYDPNDKTGYPTGIGSYHFVKQNQQIQYKIRFQNTGNDTAFNIVIRDTLDINLNLLTVKSGISSHESKFKICENRVLEWTFENILLPDSTTNEPNSHGFITFTVDMIPNLDYGTVIQNKADIYFDYNQPITTNQTTHTLFDFSSDFFYHCPFISTENKIKLYPNPASSFVSLIYPELTDDAQLNIYNIWGKKLNQIEIGKGSVGYNLSLKDLPDGLYFIVFQTKEFTETSKLIKHKISSFFSE